MRVDLWQCSRCKLLWAEETTPTFCPHCRRRHSVPAVIILAGKSVDVGVVKLYGESILSNPVVQKQFAALDLGDRCEHGYISRHICAGCNA